MDRRAFVFSSMAFLLAVPAVILAASLLEMMSMADTATSTVVWSDKVFYAGKDLDSSLRRSACNFIFLNTEDSGAVNATAVKSNLTSIWVPFVENNYSSGLGVVIDVDENFDVSYTASTRKVTIDWNGGGIPVNVSTPEGEILYNLTLGPYYLPWNCGIPSETQCNPTVLSVTITSPTSGSSYCSTGGACSAPVGISATVVDNCGDARYGGDATVTVKIYNSTGDLNATVTLTDSNSNGTYTGTWTPSAADTYDLSATATDLYGASGGGTVSNVEILDCSTGNNPPEISSVSPGDMSSCGGGTQNISFYLTDNDLDTVNWAIVYSNDPTFSTYSYINGTTDILECGKSYQASANLTYTTTTYYYILATDGTNTTTKPPGSYYTITVSAAETTPGTITFNTTQTAIEVTAPYTGDCDGDNSAKISRSGDPSTYSMLDSGTDFTYTFSGLSCGTSYDINTTLVDPDNSPPIPSNITSVTTDACPPGCNKMASEKPDNAWELKQNGDLKDKLDKVKKCNDGKEMDIEEKWKKGKREWKVLIGNWLDASIDNNACSASLYIRYKFDKDDPGTGITGVINFTGGMTDSEEKVIADVGGWKEYNTSWYTIDGTQDTNVTLSIKEQANSGWGNGDKKKVKIDCILLYYKYS